MQSPHEARRARLEALRDRFIAASMRGRALRLRRTSRAGAVDLTRLRRASRERWCTLVAAMGREEREAPLTLCPVQAPGELGRLGRDLEGLARAVRDERVETGADTLALGWPLLRGVARGGSWLRGPLLLYPASLSRSERGELSWQLALEAPALNEALVQALARLAGARLDLEAMLERDADGILTPDAQTWHTLWRALGDAGLTLHEQADASLPSPVPLQTWDAAQRAQWPEGRFDLEHALVLGRFPIASSHVAQDYQALLDGALERERLGAACPLLDIDETDPDALPVDPPELERGDGEVGSGASNELDWRPFRSDASQDTVARLLGRAGQGGLVVQGPPGTGKSQLIANLLCAAIARDERVLMVCQKRAALDVVARRLQAHGLRDALAVVHDVSSDRQAVCRRITTTLEAILEAGDTETVATRVQLEAAADAHDRAAGRARAHLSAAQRAWHLYTGYDTPRPGLAELFERAVDDPGEPLPDLSEFADQIDRRALSRALGHIEELAPKASAVAAPHPWRARGDLSGAQPEDLQALARDLEQLGELLGALARAQRLAKMTPGQARERADLLEQLAELFDALERGSEELLDDLALFWTWCDGSIAQGQWRQVTERLRRARRELAPAPWELVAGSRERLERWLDEIEQWRQLEGRWWRVLTPRFWRLRRLPEQILEAAPSWQARADQAPLDLRGMCRAARGWQELIAELPEDNAFFDFGFQGDPDQLEQAVDEVRAQHRLVSQIHTAHRELAALGDPYDELPDLFLIDPAQLPDHPFFAALVAERRQLALIEAIAQTLDGIGAQMSPGWRARVLQACERAEVAPARASVDALLARAEDLPEAARADRACAGQPAWVRRFVRLWERGASRASAAGALRRAVERAWRAWWLEGQDPASARAPLVAQEHRRQLAEAVERRRARAGEAILARYRSRLLERAGDPGARKALRRLAAQARKQRYRLTLRQLVERFWEDGLALTQPVWLCSPDSVASLFPLRQGLFDVVIFDEASQCPVESAVGALARARRAVIAGDDQQMPPSHFFRAAPDEDLEAGEAEELLLGSRSLLEVARSALPGVTLRWHYRSRHEELIAFSNAAFYGGRLYTAPGARVGGRASWEGVHFERIGGRWIEQTNRAEARRVVDWIERLLRAPEPPSVGVVTFNLGQAELIEHLLERRAQQAPELMVALERDRARPLTDQLFVRNLENVQGDERDVIVMSVGYGPSEPGGPVHARFGPLSLSGGHRRLNVAITRARSGYVVVCSFDPDALDVSGTRHEGPKLLRAFLRYARAVGAGDEATVAHTLEEAAAIGGAAGVAATHRDPLAPPRLGGEVLEELAGALQARGLDVEREVGLGHLRLDLAVRRAADAEARLGVDVTGFLNQPDAMTREVYLPRFWARMGWQILRLTPEMWRQDRAGVIAEIEARLAPRAAASEEE